MLYIFVKNEGKSEFQSADRTIFQNNKKLKSEMFRLIYLLAMTYFSFCHDILGDKRQEEV